MHTKKLDTFLHKTRIKVLRLIIKCGMIAHSAEETRQQNEQWGWGLETTEKWEGGGSGQKLKEGGGEQAIQERIFIKQGNQDPLPTLIRPLNKYKLKLYQVVLYFALFICNGFNFLSALGSKSLVFVPFRTLLFFPSAFASI